MSERYEVCPKCHGPRSAHDEYDFHHCYDPPARKHSIAHVAHLEAELAAEREAKRFFANKLMDLVEVGRRLANKQPAANAATQQEADLWAKFYRLLNEAPVTFAEARK